MSLKSSKQPDERTYRDAQREASILVGTKRMVCSMMSLMTLWALRERILAEHPSLLYWPGISPGYKHSLRGSGADEGKRTGAQTTDNSSQVSVLNEHYPNHLGVATGREKASAARTTDLYNPSQVSQLLARKGVPRVPPPSPKMP